MNETNQILEAIQKLNSRISTLEDKLSASPKSSNPSEAPTTEEKYPSPNFELLSKKSNIPLEKIQNLFDIDGNMATILKSGTGTSKERTHIVALSMLMFYKYAFGKSTTLASEIKRNASINGIPVDNFGTYLNEISPRLILRKGKAKSTKVEYKLTTLGEFEAKKALETLSEASTTITHD